MNFYRHFKQLVGLKSPRLKLALIAGGKAVGMRYVGIFIDPVLACNLRCRMCYFSDPNHVKGMRKGLMSRDEIDTLRKSVMRKALKMQIGCGAEPTLYKDLPYLIKSSKEEGVPYVEITTNGQLLTQDSLEEYIRSGLDGITISLHGTTEPTYENLMAGGSFARFLSLLDILKKIKRQFPKFILRVNYTANNLNKAELANLWELFGDLKIDVLQVRPIQKIGESSYDDFTIENYEQFITGIIDPLKAECERRGVTALLPTIENITNVNKTTSQLNDTIEEVTYCYIAPGSCYREGFNPQAETIDRFQRRVGITKRLWKTIFTRHLLDENAEVTSTKKLNYQ